MDDSPQADDDITWASLSGWDKAVAAFGMIGLAFGVGTALLAVLLLVLLAVAAASFRLVEADGTGTLFWGVALLLPCNVLAALFTCPLRWGIRLTALATRTKKAAEAVLSMVTTFLAVLFTVHVTPGLRVHRPWLPALLTALLVALANVGTRAMEKRAGKRVP
ncbi:hypothetical protein H340_28445 [Streptomyces mobaraensis NBRC 13819 = DSM 40847]|uniref:Uncharacterized protein n=1 Tax=Streptomyces mobaraensis (strain ATCC 29032 / DSM 40847 / JCM 4168 / NBRC 13819 / NCIMB 11159 / IPCR 16-22) TaxID=1223523 RepID=M3BZ38_STRM1|nr:hypothetical protein [Streptomyces mobaraensis]EME97040.1 hypothetical protein H340_28445 [Streptomyces mobaraensis NBRC 13819 = DSM 40847]